MTTPALAVWLNVISTIAIVAALIFTALQVRQGNIKRRDQASVTLIQTIQSEGWTRMLDLIGKLPDGAQILVVYQFDNLAGNPHDHQTHETYRKHDGA